MKINEKIIPPKKLNTSFNLKSFICLLIFIELIISQNYATLEAKEPRMAILDSVYSNEIQKFTIKKNNFICQPYGVISLESLKKNSKSEDCKKSIESFYINNPNLLYYADSLFRVKQMYHVRFKDLKCLISVESEVTLSEVLIREGIAFKSSQLEDKELNYLFETAQENAKYNKRGLWSSDIKKDCSASLGKE